MARSAGVSPATVSRYLNGSLHLPAPTRLRIDKAVGDLDYQPNPHARRLSLGRSDTLALLLPDIANPFFARLAAAVAAAATERGIMVALQGTNSDADRELRALDHAHRNLVDGVIFVTNQTASPRVAKALRRFGRAVVLDGEMEGANAPSVICANEEGGFLAGRCLRESGHRRVAYLGGPSELRSTKARLAGLRRGIGGGSGEDAPIRTYSEDHAAASGRAAVSRFLDERDGETALFVGSDELLVGVLEMFRERDVRVPHDISLISFDGVRSLHLFDPAITTVVQPVDALGRRAVEMLLDGTWDDEAFRASRELLPVSLIERASVAPPASPPNPTRPRQPTPAA